MKMCLKCGAPIIDTAGYCGKCGASQSRLEGDTFNASEESGESMINTANSFISTDLVDEINPIQMLLNQLVLVVKNIKNAFKDKRKLLPAVILSAVWLVLILLPRLGVNFFAVQALSFLTFAQGGVSNNIIRVLGGIIGKAVYAYLVTTVAVSVANGKSPLENFRAGFKKSVKSYRSSSIDLPLLLAGIGTAFIAFNFMAGLSSAWKSMAAVAAMLLTVRAIGNGGGFLFKFLGSIFSKGKSDLIKQLKIGKIMSGLALGFALAIPVSFIKGVYLCYIIGIILLVAAIIVHLVLKPKKEATAS